MADFATAEWIDDLAARAARVEVDAGLRIIVEQRIIDETPSAWSVSVADGRVQVTEGENPAADLRLTSDRATAEDIHAGRRSAQRAFLDGDLQIGGDVSELIAHRRAFDTVTAVVADVT